MRTSRLERHWTEVKEQIELWSVGCGGEGASVKDDVAVSNLNDWKQCVAINRNGEETRSQVGFSIRGGVENTMHLVLNTLPLRFLGNSHVDLGYTATFLRIESFPSIWFNSMNDHSNPRRKLFLKKNFTHEIHWSRSHSSLDSRVRLRLQVCWATHLCASTVPQCLPAGGYQDQDRVFNCHSSQWQTV